MAGKVDVAGLGNALVDALVVLDDDAVFADLDVPRGQMTPVDDARWQAAFECVTADGRKAEIQSGGSCANTIAAFGLLGGRGIYCGQVGKDEFGRLYAERLTEACGAHALQWTDGRSTGKCLSLISASDAERTLITDLGAAVHLPGLGDFDEVIRNSQILHLTGYLLLGESMSERAMEAIAVANQAEIPVSLDLADPFVVNGAREIVEHLVEEFADLLFLNAQEAEALVGSADEDAVRQLGEQVDTVVLKLGAEGSLVHRQGTTVRVGIHPVTALDTTGAGDSYAAGFLYGRIHGWSDQASADLGARVASMTVGQVGAVVRDRARMSAAREAATPGELVTEMP